MKVQPVPGVPSTYSLRLDNKSVIIKNQELFVRPDLNPTHFFIQPYEGLQYIITEVPGEEQHEGLSLVWSLNQDSEGAPVVVQPRSFKPEEGQTFYMKRIDRD